MSQERFGIYAGRFVHAGGSLDITQMEGDGASPEATKRRVRPGGSVDPAAIILSHAETMRRFRTSDLATLLATVSLTTGLACTGGSALWMQQRAEQGVFAAGSNHHSLTSALGFLYVEEISAAQDDENGASANCVYTALYDGSTLPFVVNSGVSLASAPTPAYVSQFFLGGVYVGAAAFEGVQNVSIRPGVNFSTKRADGDVYPRKGSIVARDPEFRITCDKISNLSGVLDNIYSNAPGSPLNCYFARGLPGSSAGRVARATTQHILIAASTGEWSPDNVDVEDTNDYSTTIIMRATGTLSLSTASALP